MSSSLANLLKQQWFIYAGMLVFGTTTAIFSKIQLDMDSKGWGDCGSHKFNKPWFENIEMFSAMIGCVTFYWAQKIMRMLSERQDPRKKRRRLRKEPQIGWGATLKGYLLIAIPAVFDLVGSGVMTMGLVFTTISVMQMLRGSMVLFSAVLSIIFLRRKLRVFNWMSIILVVFGLALVGVAAVGSGQGSNSFGEAILGCVLVIASQFIQACQIVVEEHFLQSVNLPPLQIVGMEGVWGLVVSVFIVSPFIYALPGSDCKGRYENTIDTLIMIYNNTSLLAIILCFAASCLFYNFFGMMITFSQSAIHRTIMEAVRTACIWVVDLGIYYFIDERYGEYWDNWAFLQLAGFSCLIIAMSLYNEVIKLPGLHYFTAEEKDAMEKAAAEKAEQKRLAKLEKKRAKKAKKGRLLTPDEPGPALETPEPSENNEVFGETPFLDSPPTAESFV